MKIRRGNILDLKELHRLLNSSPELQSNDGSQIYTREFVKGAWTDKKRNLVLVAGDNKILYCFLIAELWKEKQYSFLCDIFVKKEYREKGIASNLIDEYEKFCGKNKMRNIMCLTLIDNKRMQKFLEKRKYIKGNKFYFYERRL